MASPLGRERRRASRNVGDAAVVRIELKDGIGNSRWVTADLIDRTDQGIGVFLVTPLKVGTTIMVRGRFGNDRTEVHLRASVGWCLEEINGRFRVGLEFVDAKQTQEKPPETIVPEAGEPDCYEIMQLSPNADNETIERVYRILAQRFHPDNAQTGNYELFLQLTQAHQTLSDPVKRASYDARHREVRKTQWQLFDSSMIANGREGEKRKREGILSLLYAKTLQNPQHAGISLRAFEDFLGCPREHLEAALWYLKGKGFITRTDSGRFAITVPGFEEAEERNLAQFPATLQLPEPRQED